MNIKKKRVVHWPLVIGYLGIVAVVLACGASGSVTAAATTATATVTPVPTAESLLRLEDGAVKVQGEDDIWVPVAGESTFELVGEVESTDPWMVTGNTFATRDSTRIAEGLETGDLVRVKGVILTDATWLAASIEPAEEQIDPMLIFIGKVDSIDPWVVHGITLAVTDDTAITGEIAPGMIVRLEILLLEDGAWDVLGIAPLSDFTEIPGCTTVTAKVLSVDGNEVQFTDWPVITLGEEIEIENEAGNQGTLSAKQMVLVVVCATEDGQFLITKIIILEANGTSANGEKVLVCHKPDKKGGHTLSIAAAAMPAHLAHGDKPGPCLQR
ncbi:MAG: hypothetical protein EHM33_26850 [Chloroflexi bacterium]|nr:MAG: hypothetical protein EHM33_26850 [Chloroflexota bacterium]